MSRLSTMLIHEEKSRRYTPESVRIIYILEGDKKGGPNAIIYWMKNYKLEMFYGKGLRDLNKMLFIDKPWESINE